MTKPTMHIREATDRDVDLVFRWSNDPLVRQNSFHTEAILYDRHCQWFSAKLADENASLYILQRDQDPLGLVRFDKGSDSTAVIGILADSSSRGKGLGHRMLYLGIDAFRKANKLDCIYAYIKPANTASIKLFEKAGFKLTTKTNKNGFECLVYVNSPTVEI